MKTIVIKLERLYRVNCEKRVKSSKRNLRKLVLSLIAILISFLRIARKTLLSTYIVNRNEREIFKYVKREISENIVI